MKSHDALKILTELVWYEIPNAMLTFVVPPDVVASTSLQTTPLQDHLTTPTCQSFLYNFKFS